MEKRGGELSITDEFKILKAIAKVFPDNHNKYLPIDENKYYTYCPSCVSFIHAKSELGKKLLLRFLDVKENGELERERNITLDFFTKEEIPQTKISMEYLTNILDIFKYDDAVVITLKKNYPILIENKDFKCAIAPRIEDDVPVPYDDGGLK